jgi:hypothetical protein
MSNEIRETGQPLRPHSVREIVLTTVIVGIVLGALPQQSVHLCGAQQDEHRQRIIVIEGTGIRFSVPDGMKLESSAPAAEYPGRAYQFNSGDLDDSLTVVAYLSSSQPDLDQVVSEYWHKFVDAGVQILDAPRREARFGVDCYVLELEYKGGKRVDRVHGSAVIAVVDRFVIAIAWSGATDPIESIQVLGSVVTGAREAGLLKK